MHKFEQRVRKAHSYPKRSPEEAETMQAKTTYTVALAVIRLCVDCLCSDNFWCISLNRSAASEEMASDIEDYDIVRVK